MSSKKFSHRVTWTKSGGLCSEHYTEGGALKAVRRYVAMSNGKLTAEAFKIEPIVRESIQS